MNRILRVLASLLFATCVYAQYLRFAVAAAFFTLRRAAPFCLSLPMLPLNAA